MIGRRDFITLLGGAGDEAFVHRFLRGASSRKKRVPTIPGAGLGLIQLVKTLTLTRTKTQVSPPMAVPEIAKADTQTQLPVALGTSFCFQVSSHATDRSASTDPNIKKCNGGCN
jgi:hypothetical protein